MVLRVMTKVKSKERQKQIISNLLLPNYYIESDKVDLEAEVDSKLTLQENWKAIKRKYGITTLEALKSDMERYQEHPRVKV